MSDGDDRSPAGEAEGDAAGSPSRPDMGRRSRHFERLLHDGFGSVERSLAPAWRRVTDGESRWPASAFVLVAIALQAALPHHLSLLPRWLLPGVAFVLLVGLLFACPGRIRRYNRRLRALSMALIGVVSLANAIAAGRLVSGLIQGTEGDNAHHLLGVGVSIWLTNVILFALWYWELDRGGPASRAMAMRQNPDFLFPQMEAPGLAPDDWEPGFLDYFYLSFTNATAFSPTDVLPLTAWTKMTMLAQSAISLATLALVIARAVNVFR